MPFSVRCYIFGLVAVAVSVIATLPLSRIDPWLLLVMCALMLAVELLSRVQIGTSGWTMSVSLVVTLITVLVLAPPAAALTGVIASLPMPRKPTWTWTKQTINSAMASLVPAAGSAVCHLAGGHAPGHFLNFPEFLWPVAAAVTTCLMANALIIAGYVGLATHGRFVDGLRGDIRRATMPYYSSAVLALIFLSLWNDIGWYTAPLVVVPMYIAHWSLSQYAKEGAAHEGTIAALVQAVEIKDSYTRGHSERVARGAEMLAQQLKMPQDRLAMLRFAGLLHDIGKLGVPTRLLTSTGGLTEEEFKLLCMHPNHGVAVLRDIRFLTEVYEGVLYHHERLDGRGYPTGKSGDDIPEFARIIGVADAFDAMTSTRSYRAARSVEEAVAELRRGAGTQFDPDLVRAFEAALELAKQSGTPWLPTELAPAEPPQDDGTATAVSGPWPLPKRVPGFSFADHDDPFVPVEWFSDWYPSWLAHGGEPGPENSGRPVAELSAGIPGQRAGEPEPAAGAAAEDLDDGWSERMHSAVVREPGPEPDEAWAWYTDPDEAGEPGSGSAAAPDRSARWPVDPGLHGDPRGSMRVRATTPEAEPDSHGPDDPSQDHEDGAADADLPESGMVPQDGDAAAEPTSGAASQDDDRASRSAFRPPIAAAESASGTASQDGSRATRSAFRSQIAAGESTSGTASQDGDRATRSTRSASHQPGAAEPEPDTVPQAADSSTSSAILAPADFDLRNPVKSCREVAGPVADPVEESSALSMPQPKPGDPEAWTPSPGPWSALEPPVETPKAGDPADADGSRTGPAAGSAWFSHGAGGSSPTLHFFGPDDPGPWPPRDPDAKDAEGSPA